MVGILAVTVIASASGYIFPDVDSISVACNSDSSNNVVCVDVGVADVGETSLVTITETGSASLFVVPISTAAPTQTATSGSSGSSSGSGSSNGSGSPSGSDSSTGSSSPSSTGSASGSKNGAGQVGPRFLGFIIAGLLVGVSLVL